MTSTLLGHAFKGFFTACIDIIIDNLNTNHDLVADTISYVQNRVEIYCWGYTKLVSLCII